MSALNITSDYLMNNTFMDLFMDRGTHSANFKARLKSKYFKLLEYEQFLEIELILNAPSATKIGGAARGTLWKFLTTSNHLSGMMIKIPRPTKHGGSSN